MNSQRLFLSLLLGAAIAAPALVQANELVDASNRMCERVKSCALKQMETQNITPEMKAMMQPMIDSMCVNMQQKFSDLSGVSKSHPLYDKATACMDSLSKLPCDKMENPNTPECVAYRDAAQKYSNSSSVTKP